MQNYIIAKLLKCLTAALLNCLQTHIAIYKAAITAKSKTKLLMGYTSTLLHGYTLSRTEQILKLIADGQTDRQTDRPTDMMEYRAAIAAKNY